MLLQPWVLLRGVWLQPRLAVRLRHHAEDIEVEPEALQPLSEQLSRIGEWQSAVSELHVPLASQSSKPNAGGGGGKAEGGGGWEALGEASALRACVQWLHVPAEDAAALSRAIDSAIEWRQAGTVIERELCTAALTFQIVSIQ